MNQAVLLRALDFTVFPALYAAKQDSGEDGVLNGCPGGNGPGVREGSRSERTKWGGSRSPPSPGIPAHMERGRVWTPWIQDAEDEIGASLRKIPHHSKERVLSVAQATPPRARPSMTLLGSSSLAPFCRFSQIFGLWYRKGCGTEEPEDSGRRVHGTGIFLPLLTPPPSPAAHWSCHPEHRSFLPISKHRYCLGIFLLPACT